MTPSLALGHTLDLGMECQGATVSRESIYILFSESALQGLRYTQKSLNKYWNSEHDLETPYSQIMTFP